MKKMIDDILPPWWILMPEKGRVAVKNIPALALNNRCENICGSLEKLPLNDFGGIALGAPGTKDIGVLKHKGFSWFYPLAALPSLKSPRWYISKENQKISALGLNLYTPQHWYAKFAKKIAQKINLSQIPANGFLGLGTHLLIALRRPPALISACEAWNGQKVSSFSFSNGTKGTFQKTTIQAVGKNESTALYIKSATTKRAQKRIHNEARMLSVLNSDARYACHVPNILFAGKFEQHCVLVQSAVQGSQGPNLINHLILGFLSKLVSNDLILLKTLPLWKKTKQRCLSNPNLASFWDQTQSRLADAMVPVTVMHGDFTPWNVLIHGDIVQVFDWECGETEGLPFFDLFHYFLQYGFLVRRWSGKKAFKNIVDLINSDLFKKYIKRINIKMNQVWPFLEFYLVFTLSGEDVLQDPDLQHRFRALLNEVKTL